MSGFEPVAQKREYITRLGRDFPGKLPILAADHHGSHKLRELSPRELRNV